MSCILVVEDDPAVLRGLTDNLKFESYEVLSASDGECGYRLIREKNPDLIILDLMLPKLSGYELCRKVRGEGVKTPILMLTARGEEADRVLGLDLGADDYVTKPFSVRELLARIRATFRYQQERLLERSRLDQEVQIAFEVQQRLFPQFRPPLKTLDYVGFCQPARGISGDYYDFLGLAPEKLGLLVADVAGKGISAALLMASLHASIRTHAPLLGDRCGEMVTKVNALLYETTTAERFVTVFYGVYDDATHLLTYANAGHEPPLLVRARVVSAAHAATERGGGWVEPHPTCVRLDSGTPPVGIFPTLPAVQQIVQLVPGDWLLIFSDGITEAMNEKEEEFGRERLLEVVLRNRKLTAEKMRHAILTEIVSYSGARPQSDDLTLIVARVF